MTDEFYLLKTDSLLQSSVLRGKKRGREKAETFALTLHYLTGFISETTNSHSELQIFKE